MNLFLNCDEDIFESYYAQLLYSDDGVYTKDIICEGHLKEAHELFGHVVKRALLDAKAAKDRFWYGKRIFIDPMNELKKIITSDFEWYVNSKTRLDDGLFDCSCQIEQRASEPCTMIIDIADIHSKSCDMLNLDELIDGIDGMHKKLSKFSKNYDKQCNKVLLKRFGLTLFEFDEVIAFVETKIKTKYVCQNVIFKC